MSSLFDEILLEPEQKKLLEALIGAERSVSPGKYRSFTIQSSQSELRLLYHPGLPSSEIQVHPKDIDALAKADLIASTSSANRFDVTPKGKKYYREMKQQSMQPIEQIESYVRNFLDAEHFRAKYPQAYEKWSQAQELLWGDWQSKLTDIGHDCRDAIKEFAEALIIRHQLQEEYPNKEKADGRIKAVIAQHKKQLSEREKEFLDALVDYWKAMIGIVNRQEHDDAKNPLTWENGRRVVFQTTIVMFEVDRSLFRIRK